MSIKQTLADATKEMQVPFSLAAFAKEMQAKLAEQEGEWQNSLIALINEPTLSRDGVVKAAEKSISEGRAAAQSLYADAFKLPSLTALLQMQARQASAVPAIDRQQILRMKAQREPADKEVEKSAIQQAAEIIADAADIDSGWIAANDTTAYYFPHGMPPQVAVQNAAHMQWIIHDEIGRDVSAEVAELVRIHFIREAHQVNLDADARNEAFALAQVQGILDCRPGSRQ